VVFIIDSIVAVRRGKSAVSVEAPPE